MNFIDIYQCFGWTAVSNQQVEDSGRGGKLREQVYPYRWSTATLQGMALENILILTQLRFKWDSRYQK